MYLALNFHSPSTCMWSVVWLFLLPSGNRCEAVPGLFSSSLHRAWCLNFELYIVPMSFCWLFLWCFQLEFLWPKYSIILSYVVGGECSRPVMKSLVILYFRSHKGVWRDLYIHKLWLCFIYCIAVILRWCFQGMSGLAQPFIMPLLVLQSVVRMFLW